MSATLNLEVAQGARLEDIKNALVGIEYSELSATKEGLSLFFPKTNASMLAKQTAKDTTILTEDIEDALWSVGLRVYFDVDASLPNPFDDVKKFIINLSKQTSFDFALSFQYESLYAHRGPNGLELSDEF